MLERILLKLAALLIERLAGWLSKKVTQQRVNRRERDRIVTAVNRLKEAHEESEIAAASDAVP